MRPLSLSTLGSVGASGEGSVWFDADDGGDGGLEFIDADAGDEDSDLDGDSDYGDAVANVRESPKVAEEQDAEEPTTPTPRVASPQMFLTPDSSPTPPHRISSSSSLTPERPKLASVLSDVSSSSTISLGPTPSPPPTEKERRKGSVSFVRRTRLPAPTSGEQMSLFTMLKRNIGKDLATVAFPVT